VRAFGRTYQQDLPAAGHQGRQCGREQLPLTQRSLWLQALGHGIAGPPTAGQVGIQPRKPGGHHPLVSLAEVATVPNGLHHGPRKLPHVECARSSMATGCGGIDYVLKQGWHGDYG
jgi:hypothetical protein